jgi:prepilin-type N-terminal cleavage/methylation domain-containing protein
MTRTTNQAERGYTILELLVVLGMVAIVAVFAWPRMTELLPRTELTAATNTLVADIRWARQKARAQGRVLVIRFDPNGRCYTVGGETGFQRAVHLPTPLSFGTPEDQASDGITFRDDAIRFSPRPGLQNSFGSVSLRTPSGQARKITVSIAGYSSLAFWDGMQWR